MCIPALLINQARKRNRDKGSSEPNVRRVDLENGNRDLQTWQPSAQSGTGYADNGGDAAPPPDYRGEGQR